jgi:pimeloyl-ACP methyl ester carboxylesterase
MARALEGLVGDNNLVLLIGHSGGALAILLAARVPQVVAVVTIAGNLDTDVWTKLHGYLRLQGSLNPIAAPP